MPDQDTIEFVVKNIIVTLEDPTQTPWQKARFIFWLMQVTSPARPFIF